MFDLTEQRAHSPLLAAAHVFFDAIVLKEADHFLMINRPEDFNRALDQAIDMILTKQVK